MSNYLLQIHVLIEVRRCGSCLVLHIPCRVAVVVVVVVITAIHIFYSVWHCGRSAPVVGAFV